MTIMLAGGMVIAAPSMMPAAHAANANLFVSAENSQFDNYMSGPQVIEVVVIDSDINDIDFILGEPKVTVNGKKLRMVQAFDGNWYAYFADKNMAILADSTVTMPGKGLDFGSFCDANTTITSIHDIPLVTFSNTVGIALSDGDIGSNGKAPAKCGDLDTNSGNSHEINVVREPQRPNPLLVSNSSEPITGQIGIDKTLWPFIQLYDLNPTGNVVIQYNKGGGVQTTTLTFDTVDDFASAGFDRDIYSQGAQVHVTVTDPWLNIDPTDNDSWTFATNKDNPAFGVYYQVFDENGQSASDGTSGTVNIVEFLNELMCGKSCELLLDIDAQGTGIPVVTLQDTDDSQLVSTDDQDALTFVTSGGSLGTGSIPVTIVEQGPNSGTFGMFDESDNAGIKITDNAPRGTSATITYSEMSHTIFAQYADANFLLQSLDIEGDSSHTFLIEIFDSDFNKNSRTDEDLDLFNPDVKIIPSLKTGSPVTLASINKAELAGVNLIIKEVQEFSDRVILEAPTDIIINNGDILVLSLGITWKDLYEHIVEPYGDSNFHGTNLFNYDIRSVKMEMDARSIKVKTDDSLDPQRIITKDNSGQGFVNIANSINSNENKDTDFYDEDPSKNVYIIFEFESIRNGQSMILKGTQMPIVSDFFSYGFFNDGMEHHERIANQIIRIEAEETGDNTSIFQGALEYIPINQVNILDANTYTNLSTIGDIPNFVIVNNNEGPILNYIDLNLVGDYIKEHQAIKTSSHSGKVGFDEEVYEIDDRVWITLTDPDLNASNELIDIFTVVHDSNDPAFDSIGMAGLPELSFGPLGRLLYITIDGEQWKYSDTCTPYDEHTGLGSIGFTLFETSSDSGIFTGTFTVPSHWCRQDSTVSESTSGSDIEVVYVDYRDESGKITPNIKDSSKIR